MVEVEFHTGLHSDADLCPSQACHPSAVITKAASVWSQVPEGVWREPYRFSGTFTDAPESLLTHWFGSCANKEQKALEVVIHSAKFTVSYELPVCRICTTNNDQWLHPPSCQLVPPVVFREETKHQNQSQQAEKQFISSTHQAFLKKTTNYLHAWEPSLSHCVFKTQPLCYYVRMWFLYLCHFIVFMFFKATQG